MAWPLGLVGVVALWLSASFCTASAVEPGFASATLPGGDLPGGEATLSLTLDQPVVRDGRTPRVSESRGQRADRSGEMKPASSVKRRIAFAPEALADRTGDSLVAPIKDLAKAGVAIAEPEWGVVNAQAMQQKRMRKNDMTEILRSPKGARALFSNHKDLHMAQWNGEKMVAPATPGDEKLRSAKGLQSLRAMASDEADERDDSRWDSLLWFGGAVLLIMPLPMIVIVVAAVIGNRRRHRTRQVRRYPSGIFWVPGGVRRTGSLRWARSFGM